MSLDEDPPLTAQGFNPLAEAAVLGALIAAPETAESVWTAMTPEMFCNPRNAILGSILLRMHNDSAEITPATVLTRVAATGKLGQFENGAYVSELFASAYGVSYAATHAENVRKAWHHREFVADATRLTVQARKPDADITELQLELAELADKHSDLAAPPVPVGGQTILDVLEANYGPHLALIPGLLWKGNRYLYTGGEGLGKALALDTPIPTPKGWTTMGELTVGQELFAPDGTVTRVAGATEVMHDRPCYRVRFSDGAEIVADAQHLWLTETLAARGRESRFRARPEETKPRGTDQRNKRRHFPEVVTTQHIAETLWARNGHALNHSVATAEPLAYPRQELPLDPYVLGAWLGDGHTKSALMTSADQEIVDNIRATGVPCEKIASGEYAWSFSYGRGGEKPAEGTVLSRLRTLGVLGRKHIPEMYQRGDVDQRLALLQGLMDTDGTVSGGAEISGRGKGIALCEFSVCDETLARDTHELLLALGIKTTWREGPATLNGRVVGTRYRLTFQTDLPVFRLSRKADRLAPLRTRRAKLRYITAAEPIESVPVRCIKVEREDGMFVAGRECIPTHNSEYAAQIAACAIAGMHPYLGEDFKPLTVQVIDAENDGRQTQDRYRRIVPLVDKLAMSTVDWSRLYMENRTDRWSLLKPQDVAWVRQILDASRPDILVMGSLYKLYRGANVNDEAAAGEVTAVLDELRSRYGCALVIEAHMGKSKDATGRREGSVRGSSAFMGWPEFGHALQRAEEDPGEKYVSLADVIRFRGDREPNAEWPEHIRRGHQGELPWVAATQLDIERFKYQSKASGF